MSKDHYRQLKPGDHLPEAEPRRYNIHGSTMLRWHVGPRQYVQVLERYVENGVVVDSGRQGPIRKRDLLAAITPDASMQAVADKFGVSPSVIRRELDRHKIEWQPRSGGTKRCTTPQQDEAIVAVYQAHGPTVAGQWAHLHPCVVRRRVADVLGNSPRRSWRNAPDYCGTCPRCISPTAALTLVPELDGSEERDDPTDLIGQAAAKYRRRAAHRLTVAVERARNAPAVATLGLDPTDPQWKQHAACTGLPAKVFYPPVTRGQAPKPDALATARLICSSCPVRDTCGQAVNDLIFHERTGVWGGVYVTHKQRAARTREQAA